MVQDESRRRKFGRIILAYPFVLIVISLLAHLLVFGVNPFVIALPSFPVLAALVISALLLLANHTWLMTSTELTRLNYNMHATPEEWAASDHRREEVSEEGAQELERHHNAHRNATENTVYFVVLALTISIVSPVVLAAQTWMIGFALGRLGHTLAYLTGNDSIRGIAMSISLVSLYGLASYLAIGLFL